MTSKLTDIYKDYLTEEMLEDVKLKYNEMLSNLTFPAGSGSLPYYLSGSGVLDWKYDIETYFDQKDITQKYKLKKNGEFKTILDSPEVAKTHNPIKMPDRTVRPARKIIVEDSEAI